ncbi:gamma-glutamyltransferase [Aquamicrobium sp. LC103]|uniref:gamma-glutamyltransferase family protein n=1 Tax=Aquamicrobium sp. LC103 TaxID=1120658 RepID=UPI00063ED181|nr:gamma-glutamyltransferase [Aquamicrobium sp. LC103]TKT74538.1 gamma-glutamyltransferase [Aquamicrobium sp. LC103]
MVTSPHSIASEAGRAVLAAGGNAIEAAIAMGAVLAVVYPHFCGLGGDAVWIVADGEGNRTSLLGIGQAAAALQGIEGTVPTRGPLSALTTACAVDSWGKAYEFSKIRWAGGHPWSSLLEPAIDLAERGFPVSSSQSFWLDYRRAEWSDWPGFAELFGSAGEAGSPFKQPRLARALSQIAAEGARSFYEGDLAQRIAAALREAGSPIRASDLERTATRMADLESVDYRGLTLLAPTAPTQGVTTLSIMATLEKLSIDAVEEGSADFYHLIVEAIKQAFLERNLIGDPDYHAFDGSMLSEAAIVRKAAAIDRQKALPWARKFTTGDTVFFAAHDRQGRSVSVLQSIYFDWGSGVVAGDTGILWQNRGAAFARAGQPVNGLRSAARPFYTLNPGLALKNGRPHLLYGTQGADGQPQTLATLLVRLIDHNLSPAEALAAPRFLLGRTFSDSRDNLKLEEAIPAGTLKQLGAMGHETALLPAHSPLCGLAGIIRVNDDGVVGAHDPRGDGCAVGV